MTIWPILLWLALALFLLAALRTLMRLRARLARENEPDHFLALMRALGTVLTDPYHIGDRRTLGWTALVLVAVLVGRETLG